MLAGCIKTDLPTTPGERSVLFSRAGIWCFPTVFTATDRIFAGSRVAPPRRVGLSILSDMHGAADNNTK